MNTFNFIYLASPYTSVDPEIMDSRAKSAAFATAALLRSGIYTYSPIAHCHSIARAYDLPRDFKFWQDYNYAMLSKALAMFVLRLPGVHRSVGLTGERLFCHHHDIPIFETWVDKINTDAELRKLKEIVFRLEIGDAPLVYTI